MTTPVQSDDDRGHLKQAILECTRTEVVRALNDILGVGNRQPRAQQPTSKASSDSNQQPIEPVSPSRHVQRPQTAAVISAGGASGVNLGERPQTSTPANTRPAVQSLSLESVDGPANAAPIDRCSFHLMQRSSAIVQEATGEPPKRYGSLRDDASQESAPTADDTADAVSEPGANDEDSDSSSIDGLQRVESWPVRFRPTTATRLIHTSHSVLKDKPLQRRPLTTTALERRKPPPSTAASERSKAQEVSRRLLGPITLEPQRPNHDVVIPNSLAANEWENELARSIINVFANKARSKIRGGPPLDKSLSEVEGELPPDGGQDLTVASSPFFAEESAFRAEEFQDVGDFQRISISRGASCFDANAEFALVPPKKEHRLQSKTPSKGGTRNMIWFAGTGMVHANWEAINGVGDEDSLDCEELAVLEEQGRYRRYIGTVEAALLGWKSESLHDAEHSELKQKLWHQLVVVCNCFATRLIEQRTYPKAMELLEKATGFIHSDSSLLPDPVREELLAMVKDTYAFYYARRSKPSASYQYLISAINIYKRRKDEHNVAKCRLHQSFIQCAQHKYSDSMKSLRKVLAMVESGALDDEADSNQVLLLGSVAYHNIAVQQLLLGHISDACVSSQNARRLARMCLSASSHYLPALESTHKTALNQLASVLKNGQNEEQAELFRALIEELFDG